MGKRIRKGFWKNLNNQRQFFDKIALQFQIKNHKDWSFVTYQDIIKRGGGSIIVNCYQGSVLQALRNIYKNVEWDPAWFSNIPNRKKGFWANKQNQKNYFEEIALKYNIKEPRDWGKLTFSDVQNKGSPLHYYGGSLFRALGDIFPETKWDKKWFRPSNRIHPLGFFRDPSNQKKFLNTIAAQYNIKEPSQWQRVSVKLIKNKGGGGLLSRYNHSVYQILTSVYPTFDWSFLENRIQSKPQHSFEEKTKHLFSP